MARRYSTADGQHKRCGGLTGMRRRTRVASAVKAPRTEGRGMLRYAPLLSTIAALAVLVPSAASAAGPHATAVSTSGGHACGLLSDATVKCWGANQMGQLGEGTPPRRLTAVAVPGLAGATSVSAGGGMTCAVLVDGTARCWGANDLGQ